MNTLSHTREVDGSLLILKLMTENGKEKRNYLQQHIQELRCSEYIETVQQGNSTVIKPDSEMTKLLVSLREVSTDETMERMSEHLKHQMTQYFY